SAILPLHYFSKVVGLAPYSLEDMFQGSRTGHSKMFKYVNAIYSIVVFLLVIFLFPFLVIWKLEVIYAMTADDGITFVIVDILGSITQFFANICSIFQLAFRSLEKIQKMFCEMKKIDILLNIKSKFYRRIGIYCIIQVLFCSIFSSLLYGYDFILWFDIKENFSDVSKILNNTIMMVMVIIFVNYIAYVKTRLKILNCELMKCFGFNAEKEIDIYLQRLSAYRLSDSDDGHRNGEPSFPDKFHHYEFNKGFPKLILWDKIRILREVNFKLNQLIIDLNSVYSIPLLLEILTILVKIAVKLHLVIVTIFFENVTERPKALFAIVNTCWITLFFVKLILMTVYCQKVMNHASHTLLLLQKLLTLTPLHKDLAKELEIFSEQLLHNNLQISPCGFFVLDHPFLSRCLEILVAYIVILLQFTQSD
ncbi:hypothetical protein L9F63_010232, partial [Diploptera punctata]